ncbi:hypothetical protein LUZ60_015297 [Juncus effusus]|nr:hypothetical protein LUZ60_015297 [Juncus effusus]
MEQQLEEEEEEYMTTKPSSHSPLNSPVGASAAPPPVTPAAVTRLAAVLDEISSMAEFRSAYKKQLHGLSRRVKLLSPLADELLDRPESLSERDVRTVEPLVGALESAMEFFKFVNEGSKIYVVLERETFIKRHQEVLTKLEESLSLISFEELHISDEVKEQVELVQAQLKRASLQTEPPNKELHQQLLSIYNNSSNDQNTLESLSLNLHLTTINDLKQESLALHEMVVVSDDPDEKIEKMSLLLKKIKDFVQTQNPKMGSEVERNPKTKMKRSVSIPVRVSVPDEFRCPISLELMRDPVIVATGQTYERTSIQKWLSTNDTCPSTHQTLTHKSLTTNYALKSLISQFLSLHNLPSPPSPPLTPRTDLDALILNLKSSDPSVSRSAVGQLRLLSKRDSANRVSISKAGAIPLLNSLLFSSDLQTQEHAVTTLLNLSICEENKSVIIKSKCVPGIINVLKNGNMEARENAAATIFSLSVVDEYKVVIGGVSGAVPALVRLLSEGSLRGKKDAATALFNLCIYQGNKGRAVRAGLIPLVMSLVSDTTFGMADECLAILAILSGCLEGKMIIGTGEIVPVLVEMVRNGRERNRENAAAVLVNVCGGSGESGIEIPVLERMEESGILNPLRDLAVSGTERGKRKAVILLERMSRYLVSKMELSNLNSELPILEQNGDLH